MHNRDCCFRENPYPYVGTTLLRFMDAADCRKHSQDIAEFLAQQMAHPPLVLSDGSCTGDAGKDGASADTLEIHHVHDRHGTFGRAVLSEGAEWVVASKHTEYARHLGRDVLAVVLEHEVRARGACWLDRASAPADLVEDTAPGGGPGESAA